MTHAFQALALRYVHDLVTGESLNVGVLVFSPSAKYLRFTYLDRLARISDSFARGVRLKELRSRLRTVEAAINELAAESLDSMISVQKQPSSIVGWARLALQVDDSSLQFETTPRTGVSSDLDMTSNELLERLVVRYSKGQPRASRTDEDVLKTFRPHLRQEEVLHRLEEKVIKTQNYQHKFELAFKNGVWNAIEPLSLDLIEKDAILDKATRWLGRAEELANSDEKFKLVFLVGKPEDEELQSSASKALNILNRIQVEKTFVFEDEAREFAMEVKAQIEHREVN